MNIVCAESVLMAEEIFSKFGNCTILPDKKISNKDLKKTDALIVRSGTTVNENLLQKTAIKFVGTATSGTDHIDKKWLKKNKIYCVDAIGSNAISVSNYVISSILSIASYENISLKGKKIAIIGCGNVGTELVRRAEAIGLITLINDPPRASKKTNGYFHSKLKDLKEILPQADIVTIHTPLTTTGKWPTKNLVDDNFLKLMKKNSIFINTSRGGVCNEIDLISAKRNNQIRYLVTDVWENEPNFNKELCKCSILSTPHIAGHSYRAKLIGTVDCAVKFSKFFDKDFNYYNQYMTEKMFSLIKTISIDNEEFLSHEKALNTIVSYAYDIKFDSDSMKKNQNLQTLEKSNFFKEFRKNYPNRREFSDITINLLNAPEEFKLKLEHLGFVVSN